MTKEKAQTLTDECAAQWAARVLSGDLSDCEQVKFANWLKADPRHSEAYYDYMRIARDASTSANAAAQAELLHDLEGFAQKRRVRGILLIIVPLVIAFTIAALFFVSMVINGQAF